MEGTCETIKGILKNQLPPSRFQLWIDPLQAETGPQGELVFACPNPFALRWVQTHYLRLIQQVLQAGGLELTVRPALAAAKERRLALPQVQQPALPLAPGGPGNGLNRAFTFEQFVVGSPNCLAYHASHTLFYV